MLRFLQSSYSTAHEFSNMRRFLLHQADYFSMFFSRSVGLNCTLRPVSALPNDAPTHFVLETNNKPMSPDEKIKVVEWGITHHPEWFYRWWRDDAFDRDMIVLNKAGDFCINAHELFELTLQLDPFLTASLKKTEAQLNKQYGRSLSLKVRCSDLFSWLNLSDETLSPTELNEFNEKLANDVYEFTGKTISISSGSSFSRIPTKVVPYRNQIADVGRSNQMMGASPTTIEKRFNRKFLCQYEAATHHGIQLDLSRDLPTLFEFVNISTHPYFPSYQQKLPPAERTIERHPVLLQTKWRPLGAFFNGQWFSPTQDNQASNAETWETLLAPTESVISSITSALKKITG